MGSHSTQAVAISVFLAAATVLCAGFAMDGNILLIIAGLIALGLSGVLFRKCKALEDSHS
jgi:LPXTG-motif cell wall-anchored protein